MDDSTKQIIKENLKNFIELGQENFAEEFHDIFYPN